MFKKYAMMVAKVLGASLVVVGLFFLGTALLGMIAFDRSKGARLFSPRKAGSPQGDRPAPRGGLSGLSEEEDDYSPTSRRSGLASVMNALQFARA